VSFFAAFIPAVPPPIMIRSRSIASPKTRGQKSDVGRQQNKLEQASEL
jgi:hypothetical protein